MVTHDPGAASYTDRVVFLADGRVVDELRAPTADRVLERMKGFEKASRRRPDAGGCLSMLRATWKSLLAPQAAAVHERLRHRARRGLRRRAR